MTSEYWMLDAGWDALYSATRMISAIKKRNYIHGMNGTLRADLACLGGEVYCRSAGCGRSTVGVPPSIKLHPFEYVILPL